ncbi:AAA family ATPase [candidate division GN15 bacterium]|nr:AAA family ATPase [candidate division GN15 bacterium]
MAGKTVLYGNIIDSSDLERLLALESVDASRVARRHKPELFSPDDGMSTVFVDLDDPRFADRSFLLSLATAGCQITVVGKCSDPSDQQATTVAKLGVSELLSAEQCLQRLETLLNAAEQVSGGQSSSGRLASRFSSQGLIGVSDQISGIRETITLLGEVDFPSALILGETGTGKSLVCKILHNSGIRANHNLVEVNCSAIPDELFESELFGHAKGAFTDAKAEKAGLFDYAQDGTLFLDEVGNLSASAQAKLLKILEDKKLRKVGAVHEQDINVRVVAATNLDLEEAIAAGTFREDLYFRLNLLTLTVPPLRERPEDVPELIDYYLAYYATNYSKPGARISQTALKKMRDYHWPGNVRELCNVIERAVLLTQSDEIGEESIAVALQNGRISAADRQQFVIDIPPQGMSLDEIEQQVVQQVLNMCDWNKTEAAKFLGISRPRLRRIITSAGLERDRRDS